MPLATSCSPSSQPPPSSATVEGVLGWHLAQPVRDSQAHPTALPPPGRVSRQRRKQQLRRCHMQLRAAVDVMQPHVLVAISRIVQLHAAHRQISLHWHVGIRRQHLRARLRRILRPVPLPEVRLLLRLRGLQRVAAVTLQIQIERPRLQARPRRPSSRNLLQSQRPLRRSLCHSGLLQSGPDRRVRVQLRMSMPVVEDRASVNTDNMSRPSSASTGAASTAPPAPSPCASADRSGRSPCRSDPSHRRCSAPLACEIVRCRRIEGNRADRSPPRAPFARTTTSFACRSSSVSCTGVRARARLLRHRLIRLAVLVDDQVRIRG